jgi:hypothetical protein
MRDPLEHDDVGVGWRQNLRHDAVLHRSIDEVLTLLWHHDLNIIALVDQRLAGPDDTVLTTSRRVNGKDVDLHK